MTKFTLLVESEELLESKHKCIIHANSLEEVVDGLVKSLRLDEQDLIIQIYDQEFEEYVALDNFELLAGLSKAKIQIAPRKKKDSPVPGTSPTTEAMLLRIPVLVKSGVISEAETNKAKELVLMQPAQMQSALDMLDKGDQQTIRSLMNSHQEKGAGAAVEKSTTHNTGAWSAEESSAFILGLEQFGRDWKKISTLVTTRNLTQIRSHAQKYFKKQAKDKLRNQQAMAASLGAGVGSSVMGGNELSFAFSDSMELTQKTGTVRDRSISADTESLKGLKPLGKRHARKKTPLEISELLLQQAHAGDGGSTTADATDDSLMSLSDLQIDPNLSIDVPGEDSLFSYESGADGSTSVSRVSDLLDNINFHAAEVQAQQMKPPTTGGQVGSNLAQPSSADGE
jgi:SHAQKYF class myb-like DNA-binding protein